MSEALRAQPPQKSVDGSLWDPGGQPAGPAGPSQASRDPDAHGHQSSNGHGHEDPDAIGNQDLDAHGQQDFDGLAAMVRPGPR